MKSLVKIIEESDRRNDSLTFPKFPYICKYCGGTSVDSDDNTCKKCKGKGRLTRDEFKIIHNREPESWDKVNEALPVLGFKPKGPPKPKRPAKPAKPSRMRAQVMTPKGRLTTVKKSSSMRKPGYGLMKFLPPKQRSDRHDWHDRSPKNPRNPIKPVAYGKTIAESTKYKESLNEMQITRFDVIEKSEKDDDSGVYHSGGGGYRQQSRESYYLIGSADVTFDLKDIKSFKGNQDNLEDAVWTTVKDEIKKEFGYSAMQGVELKIKKLGANKYRVDIVNSNNYIHENMKSLGQIIRIHND